MSPCRHCRYEMVLDMQSIRKSEVTSLMPDSLSWTSAQSDCPKTQETYRRKFFPALQNTVDLPPRLFYSILGSFKNLSSTNPEKSEWNRDPNQSSQNAK